MKLFKYALLLVVLIGLVSVASADIDTFYISSYTYSDGTTHSYKSGSPMTVTATSKKARVMWFKWYPPGSSSPITDPAKTELLNGNEYTATSTYTPNTVGMWTLEVHDGDSVPEYEYIYFWVQVSGVSYSYSMSGTDTDNDGKFQVGNSVTCTVAPSTSSSGQSMRIMWYLGSTLKQTHDVSKTGSTYVDTLDGSLGLFDTAGSWHVEVYESSSSSYSDSTRVGSGENYFESESQADDVPEFPLGSFVPLLLAGAVYLKVRRNMEGS